MPCIPRLALALGLSLASCTLAPREGSHDPAPGDLQAVLDRVIELEDARQDDGGELLALLEDARPRVRMRAALALGRFPLDAAGAAATAALVAALDDGDRRVRETAAFGLGLRGDRGASLALLARWRDPDPEVRAALVEAATRIGDADLVPHVLAALADPAPGVRAAAALGAHRWPGGDDPRWRAVDAALASRTLRPTSKDGRALAGFDERIPGESPEPEDYGVAWAALFSLQRRGGDAGRAGFLRWARAEAPLEARLFAVKGLARVTADAQTVAALVARAADEDWRIAVEAVRGLGAAAGGGAGAGAAVTALGASLSHRSVHVRSVAWEALAAYPDPAPVRHLLARFADEDAPPARAAALGALVRLRGERALGEVRELAASADVIERAGAAAALASLPTDAATPLLLTLSRDAHPRVAGAALGSMAPHLAGGAVAGEELRARLHAALEGSDAALRLAAAQALRDVVDARDLSALRIAALTSRGDGGPEARFEAARTLARIEGDAALRTLEQLAADSDPHVARVAAGLAAERGGAAASAPLERGAPPREVPRAWDGPDPRVTFVTSRGELTFRLLPREAPVHVHNLLELVRRGAYDGTVWHRVVPDFVAQGGGGRGDGNGGGTWRGPEDGLRLEVTRRGFGTGTLGMPRNEDPDSGGRQLFVTHRPTPHLDGRYTVLGELVKGADVLAALQEGDAIEAARRDE